MNFNTKPTISLRKYDETEFINIRTYWSLTHTDNALDGCTYELQVRHDAVEDVFTFISHAAHTRDPLELVTHEAWEQRVYDVRMHEDMSDQDARAALADKIDIMTVGEANLLAHLTRTWDAFTLLFNPIYNM